MAKFKAGGGVAEAEPQRQPQQTAEATSDAFDAWASVLSGDAMAEISEAVTTAEGEQVQQPTQPPADVDTAAVTIAELPPIAIAPVMPVAVAECEVVEVKAIESSETEQQPNEARNAAESVVRSIEEEAAGILGTSVEPPEIAAAKTAYLTACLRLSAVEVRLDGVNAEIEDLESSLELAKERRDELSEKSEPAHATVKELYQRLAALLTPEELAEYAADIERGTVAISGTLPPASSSSDGTVSPSCSSSSPSTAMPATADNSAWRLRPTKELDFTSVRGLGEKKVAAILEACPTIGDFEDMRASHSKDGKPGLTQIPGVGTKLAGDLENLMLEWLANNRDWGVLQEAAAEAKESPATPATDMTTPATPTPVLQQTSFLPDDAVVACGRPPTATNSDQQSGDGLPPQETAEPPAAGEASTSEDGQPADEPPAGSLPADKQPSDGKPPPTPQEAAEIAALASRFKELYSAFRDHGQSGFAAKDEWSQYASMGKDDYINGLKFEECVFTAGDRQDHWLWGFIGGMIESKRA